MTKHALICTTHIIQAICSPTRCSYSKNEREQFSSVAQPQYFKMDPMWREGRTHTYIHTHKHAHRLLCSLSGRASVIAVMPFSPTHHCTVDIAHWVCVCVFECPSVNPLTPLLTIGQPPKGSNQFAVTLCKRCGHYGFGSPPVPCLVGWLPRFMMLHWQHLYSYTVMDLKSIDRPFAMYNKQP